MQITFNKKTRLVACGLWLVACGLWLVACKQEGRAETSSKTSLMMPCAQLSSCVSGLRSSLVRKIIENNGSDKISLEEIRKYDFNFPDSVNYKNSKQFSIFYGSSSSDFYKKQNQTFQSMIKESSNNGEIIYTIANRVNGLGTEAPELVAIIPNFKEQFCQKIMNDAEGIRSLKDKARIPRIDNSPNLLPHSEMVNEKDIITLPHILKQRDWDSGCFEAQGKYYYFYTLYSF